jgi:hypothetical protein
MDVCLLWVFVLSGRGLCDRPIPRPEGVLPTLVCVWVLSSANKQPGHILWVRRRDKDYEPYTRIRNDTHVTQSKTDSSPWHSWQRGLALSTKVVDRFSLTTKRSEKGEDEVRFILAQIFTFEGRIYTSSERCSFQGYPAVTQMTRKSTLLPSTNPGD